MKKEVSFNKKESGNERTAFAAVGQGYTGLLILVAEEVMWLTNLAAQVLPQGTFFLFISPNSWIYHYVDILCPFCQSLHSKWTVCKVKVKEKSSKGHLLPTPSL